MRTRCNEEGGALVLFQAKHVLCVAKDALEALWSQGWATGAGEEAVR
jgi:hypothetical protein